MKLTPLDIQQQQFRTGVWGFDQKEVDAFLDMLAADVEALIRDNNSLKEELKRKDGEILEHRERERTLKDTMVTATRITEDIKQNARKEAEILIAQAESQAEQIIQNAHTRLVRIMEDIDELKRQKAQFEVSLRSTIATHAKLLETMTDKEGGSQPEAQMLPLRRRNRDAEGDDGQKRAAAARDGTTRMPAPDDDLLVPRGGDR